MGYTVQAEGSIVLKEGASASRAEEILWDVFEVFTDRTGGGRACLEVAYNDAYDEDSCLEALDNMKELAESGTINYVGEDGAVWRHVLRHGSWEEDSGPFCFLSDKEQELLRQLVRREISSSEGKETDLDFLYALLDHLNAS